MKKHFAAACLLGTALVSAPALAQDSGAATVPPATASAGQFLTQMDAAEWRGSKLVGVDVYGSDNSKIGDINEVLVDHNGQVKGIVIGVGGFLGIGEKNVAIPWNKVQWNMGGDKSTASTASTASTTGGMPAGDRSSPRDMAQTTTGSPADTNAQSSQSVAAAAGGAALSTAPGSTTSAPATTAPASSMNSTASTTSTTASTASTSASSTSQDYPDRALVSMSKQDLQNAPEFKYASEANKASSGSSMTGTTGSTSGR